MLDDGIDRTALMLHEQTELAFELGFESLDEYLEYLQKEWEEQEVEKYD